MASINEYSSPVQNTLEGYIPLPLDQLFRAGQAIQQRGDLAQQQTDQVQTGLSSMEALAPAHRDFVNKFATDFKSQQMDLLNKYQGNTSDPQYINEARKLSMQFAADPKLQIIKQANDLLKKKQETKDRLDANGVKYIDSNPQFTGVDTNGNLSSNPGGLQATDFDSRIDNAFKSRENAIEQVGHTLTNRENLKKVQNHYLESWDGNSEIQQGLKYYEQQGQTPDQAKATMLQHVAAGMGYAKDQKDHFYEQLAWDKEKFNMQEADRRAAAAAKANKLGQPVNPADIFSNTSPILAENLGKEKISKVDNTINNLNSGGGLKKGIFDVEDTPENRKKYAGKYTAHPDVDLEGIVTGSKLQIPGGYNKDESYLVDEARSILGNKAKNPSGGYLSDKHVLEKYKEILSNSQAEAYNYHIPGNEKYDNALTSQYFGKNMEKLGSDYIVITPEGKFKSSDPKAQKALANVDHLSTIGTNPAPLGDYVNGTVAATGVMKGKDDSGKTLPKSSVIVIKPMDQTTASNYRFSNLAARALNSPYGNEELLNNPEAKTYRIVNPSTGQQYAPQKGLSNSGKISVKYVPIDDSGNIIKGKALDISSIEAGEHSNYYTKLGQSIYTKPEAQNYKDNSDEE